MSLAATAQHNVKVYDLLNELKYATQDTAKADIMLNLAKAYFPTDVDKAISKAELALMIAQNHQDKIRTFDALIILIEGYHKKQALPTAAKYLSQLQSIKNAISDPMRRAQSYGIEGKVFLALQDFEKAHNAFKAQLDIYERNTQSANNIDIANTYFELGELNYLQGAFYDAIAFYNKALNVPNTSDDVQRRIETLNALGRTYFQVKDYNRALQYSSDAQYLSESISDKALVANIYINVANALFALGRNAETIDKLTSAESLAESVNDNQLLAKAKLLHAKVIYANGDINTALSLSNESLAVARTTNKKVIIKDIYEFLYALYDSKNDVSNAHLYLKELVSIRDSLNSEEQAKQVNINKIRFETEATEAENQRLLAQQLENQVTIQRQKASNYILLALLLLVGAGGYSLYQNLNRKKAYNRQLEDEVKKRTEQLEASNEDMARANKLLEQSNAELERFAYIASHDLKSPLRNIISFLNLIERKLRNVHIGNDIREYLRFATENAWQMNTLIQDVLEFSRIDSETLEQKREKVDLNDTLVLAIQNLQESIRESGAEIIAAKLPIIEANSVHFLQLFQNIIGNGIKYNQQAQPKVEINYQLLNSTHIITIKDNGIGIDPQYHEQIFEMFKRLHTRDEYKGTGIGLAICKKIIQNLGGKIWIESDINQGSTFFISIPSENTQEVALAA